MKWGLVARADADQKYVICNGDEGDPGAYMDRAVMEGDPHRVLEGMAIAAYAVGANQGFIYVRGEYPVAIRRLQRAIRQAERQGVLGGRIFETPFQFRVDIRIGGGAFVCGEETALIASIEGGRGSLTPARRTRPGRAVGQADTHQQRGDVRQHAPIVAHGGGLVRRVRHREEPGDEVFALAGKVNNTGLIEVPLGITVRDVVEQIGGGIVDGRAFKAMQTGGPSGGCYRRPCSTCRWTTSPCSRLAPSSAPADCW